MGSRIMLLMLVVSIKQWYVKCAGSKVNGRKTPATPTSVSTKPTEKSMLLCLLTANLWAVVSDLIWGITWLVFTGLKCPQNCLITLSWITGMLKRSCRYTVWILSLYLSICHILGAFVCVRVCVCVCEYTIITTLNTFFYFVDCEIIWYLSSFSFAGFIYFKT